MPETITPFTASAGNVAGMFTTATAAPASDAYDHTAGTLRSSPVATRSR